MKFSDHQWLQFDLGPATQVTGMVTRGQGDRKRFVTSYTMAYSNDSVTWHEYKDSNHLEAKVSLFAPLPICNTTSLSSLVALSRQRVKVLESPQRIDGDDGWNFLFSGVSRTATQAPDGPNHRGRRRRCCCQVSVKERVGLKIRPFSSLRRLFFELTDGKRREISDRPPPPRRCRPPQISPIFFLYGSFGSLGGYWIGGGNQLNLYYPIQLSLCPNQWFPAIAWSLSR